MTENVKSQTQVRHVSKELTLGQRIILIIIIITIMDTYIASVSAEFDAHGA